MVELLDIMGALQAKGGVLLCFVWLIYELRRLRADFNRHEHDDDGKPFLKVVAE